MKKLLLGLTTLLLPPLLVGPLLVPSSAVGTAGRPATRRSESATAVRVATDPAVTLLSDDYEGAVKWNGNSSGWSISTTYAVSGTHSAHAPSQSGSSPSMYYGPIDLSTASGATLSFELWYYAPKLMYPNPPTACGAFCIGYSFDGSHYSAWPVQWGGDTDGLWESWELDLNSTSFPLVGHSQVWLAFMTTQWTALASYSEGAYVDDLTVTATVPDTTPPTTTASGVVNGRWYNAAVTVRFSATDNAGGSGVDHTEYSLDGGTTWTPGDSLECSESGSYTVLYRSLDLAGNPEKAKTLTFGIDTARPTTKAPSAASAYRYRTAKLRYQVLDATPNGGSAVVTLKVKNRAGKVVKKLGPYSGKTIGSVYTAKFTCTLAKGKYRFYVYATDAAGNGQAAPAGSNVLTVK